MAARRSAWAWAHESFYCPNGHSQYFPGKSDLEKEKTKAEALRGRRAAARQSEKYVRDRLEEERRSKAAIKGHLTRTKKRVATGVCPCCNRTFENLARHMEAKHPEYAEAD